LAAGFGSFGAGLLMVGIVIVMTSTPSDATAALAVIGGAIIGNFLVALRIEVGGRACALGLMLVFAISLATDTDDAGLAMLGLALIACLAAIGGAIGARVRRSREAPPDLPAAQVR
jgi:hypothetical protein